VPLRNYSLTHSYTTFAFGCQEIKDGVDEKKLHEKKGATVVCTLVFIRIYMPCIPFVYILHYVRPSVFRYKMTAVFSKLTR